MNTAALPGRTANARLVADILRPTLLPSYEDRRDMLAHELVTTANASLFTMAHFSEPMTQYATGWVDPNGYDAVCEFLAPSLPSGGQRYEHITYPNAEAFLSDGSYDDLRAIGADFKTVDYTEDKTERTIPNRGLRIVLDYDKVKDMPAWQQHYTGMLLARIKRNAFRRKWALGVASATQVTPTWDETSDPDHYVADQARLSGDSSGVAPNRALWGLSAKLLRFSSYGAQETAAAFAGRSMTPEEAGMKAGLQAIVDESRYQNGASKSSIVGANVLLFTGAPSSSEDPSNFKTARGTTQAGGRYAVYVRQIGVKFWEITAECYETEFCASTLGVRLISPTS